jgi:hypothetical protein
MDYRSPCRKRRNVKEEINGTAVVVSAPYAIVPRRMGAVISAPHGVGRWRSFTFRIEALAIGSKSASNVTSSAA